MPGQQPVLQAPAPGPSTGTGTGHSLGQGSCPEPSTGTGHSVGQLLCSAACPSSADPALPQAAFIGIQSASAAFFPMSRLLITKSPEVCSCVNQKAEMLQKSHFSKNKPLAPVGAAELQSQGSLELSSSPTPPALGAWGAVTSLCPTQAARLVQVMLALSFLGYWEVQEDFAVLHQGGRCTPGARF